ncbi:MAG: pyrroline-5-carboxylate reductase [Spirochaetia bacterium]|nr:pyrroline-5-carboxylate reductase [Spirochaetia bacterium]
MSKEIGVIGLGKMGGVIAGLLIKHDYKITAFDVNKEAANSLQNKINFSTEIKDILKSKIPVILAVKPAFISKIISQIADERLLISIAAGVNTSVMQYHRKVPGPVIRVMPNTPFLIQKGTSVLYADKNCSEDDKKTALDIFSKGGDAFFIENENWMHAVTALSGSGPAFVELFLQALEDAGVLSGLPRDISRSLVLKTAAGTVSLVENENRSPQDHILDVTSPGGTTIYGLKALKKHGFENAVYKAIKSAVKRSVHLEKESRKKTL